MNSYEDLPKRLDAFNAGNKYQAIIERARNKGYHDFKFDAIPDHPEYGECDCPKMQLFQDLLQFPELHEVCVEVMQGKYDDSPDQEDGFRIRAMLLEDEAPDFMFKEILGQDPPTQEEREQYKNSAKLS